MPKGLVSILHKQQNMYSFVNCLFSSLRESCPDIFSIQCTCIMFVWRYQLDFLFFKDVMTFLYSFELSFMYVQLELSLKIESVSSSNGIIVFLPTWVFVFQTVCYRAIEQWGIDSGIVILKSTTTLKDQCPGKNAFFHSIFGHILAPSLIISVTILGLTFQFQKELLFTNKNNS